MGWSLFPPRLEFYDMLLQQGQLNLQAAITLQQAIQAESPEALAEASTKIAALEHESDHSLAQLVAKVDRSFYTPLDTEDLINLANQLDDVVDGLEDVVHRLVAYRIYPVPVAAKELCDLLVPAQQYLVAALGKLREGKNLLAEVRAVFLIEKQADGLERQAVAEVLNSGMEGKIALKLRELYEVLEDTHDASDRVALTLQHIHIKQG